MSKMWNVMCKLWNTTAESYLTVNPIPCLYLAIYSLHSAFHILPDSSVIHCQTHTDKNVLWWEWCWALYALCTQSDEHVGRFNV